MPVLCAFLALLQTPSAAHVEGPVASAAPEPPLCIERGSGTVPLLLPRGEELQFDVIIDLGILGDFDAGDVVLSSGSQRILPGGLPSARDGDRRVALVERGWIKGVATGGYAGYSMHDELDSSHLTQDWPRVFYTDVQTGSENRRRELRVGLREGRLVAEYRSNKHCPGCDNREHFVDSIWTWGRPHHCQHCKRAEHRVWRDPESRTVPDDTLDMLSAVYIGRTLIQRGIHETTFPLIDRQTLWRVRVEQGELRRQKVPAGRFQCREVRLGTEPLPGPNGEIEKDGFRGLFGIQGTIRIWFEAASGVPVLIEGELPIPVPLVGKLDVSVRLKGFKGTPAGFAPQ